MKISTSRLKKLETSVNEHRKQKRLKPAIDFSTFSDEELKTWHDDYLLKNPFESDGKYEGKTDQELSDLYFQSLKNS